MRELMSIESCGNVEQYKLNQKYPKYQANDPLEVVGFCFFIHSAGLCGWQK
jgi:hypothetical protein